ARELPRIDLNAVGEAADAGLVDGQELLDELGGGIPDEVEVRDHAAAAVEHHHDRNRLDVVGEERQRLPLAVVEDLEVLLLEVGDEAAAGLLHGGENRHGAGTTPERRLLPRGTLLGRDQAETNENGQCLQA